MDDGYRNFEFWILNFELRFAVECATHDSYSQFFYSLDGVKFVKFKMIYLKSFEDVKVGAYISSMSGEEFFAELSDISVEDI